MEAHSRSLSDLRSPSATTAQASRSSVVEASITPKTPGGARLSTIMASDRTAAEKNGEKHEILTYRPLASDNAVSANPHIPSVSASAVLGESDSVRSMM